MKTMKTFKGKAIYNPSGKAGEYAEWACNFYTGCSNNCSYCYLKKGVLSHTWSITPQLKKCFKDENHALEIFKKELMANLPELQKHGLFFTFTSDPFLTISGDKPYLVRYLTQEAVNMCVDNDVFVKLLTKRADVFYSESWKKHVSFGFTLTGHDELEPNTSTNSERIEAMRKLHDAGFKTFASIEPIIDFESSAEMIRQTRDCCDFYKNGLMSGKRYEQWDIKAFIQHISNLKDKNGNLKKIYFKDSLLQSAGVKRENLPANCVGMDYNIFNI